jgi:hypothetical protein
MKEAVAPPAVTHEPEPRQAAEVKSVSGAGTRLNRSFAGVPVVADRPDDGKTAAIEALLGHLASQLGLRPGQIQVRVDREAEVIVSQRGADGAARQGVVYLRSDKFDPTSRTGRRLLAHESAHAAQALLPQAAAEPNRRRHIAAELEAERTADIYVATRTAQPVRVPLAPSATVFNTGVDALVEPVKQSRGAEIARIIDLLSYGVFDWAVTDGDVFDVLHILNSFPLVTARAIARNIGPKYRERLFGNLKAPHYSDYRAEILAVAWAAESEDEFKDENYQILNRVSLTDLDPLEAVAVDAIVTLSPKVMAEARTDGKRAARIAEAQQGAKSEAAGKALSAAVEEAQAEEKKVIEARAITDASLDALGLRPPETV